MAKKKDEPLGSAKDCVELLFDALRQALHDEGTLQSTRQVKCKQKPEGEPERSWTEEEPTGKVDIGRLKDCTAVLDDLIAIKRGLYDLPTGEEAERREQAKQKLALSMQKEAQPDTVLQVCFSDEAAQWAT